MAHRLFAGSGILVRHCAQIDQAPRPLRGGGVRDDDEVPLVTGARFCQQRHVVDHDAARISRERGRGRSQERKSQSSEGRERG